MKKQNTPKKERFLTQKDHIMDLLENHQVVILGDFTPIDNNQYAMVQKAVKIIADAGLKIATTNFYVDSTVKKCSCCGNELK